MWLVNDNAVKAFDEAHRERTELQASGFAPEVLERSRAEKLDRLWDRLERVPRYRGRPGIAERSLADAELTAKDELKGDPAGFLQAGVGPYHKYYETSGSTGTPTPTPRLIEDMVWNTVSVASLWSRLLRPGDRVVSLLPSDVAPVGDLVASTAEYLGCTLLRGYPFSQGITDWDRLEALFANYRPQHVFAAPGVLLQWTRLLKQRGRFAEVSAGVETLLLLGEVSTPPLRARLAEQWGARALNVSYGSTETGTIAASCEHDRLHLLEHGHLAEVLADGRAETARGGSSGELVVTPLNNHARPLLRYATGDLVTITDGCPCGITLPVVTVHGRSSERLSVAGQQVTVEAIERLVYTTPGITGYLVQLKRPDGEAARLVLERDIDFTGDEQAVRADVEARSAALGITWAQVVLVSQLPQTTKAGGSQKNWKRTNLQWTD